jgi:hypothetical protein
MVIAYAITVCNEFKEADRLIRFLKSHIRPEDQIYVLLDKPKVDPPLLDLLYRFSSSNWITLRESAFGGDFSKWKNELIELCNVHSTKPDFIFNIDADELPTKELIDVLPTILENNSEIDLYWIPRWNTVEGLTQEHIKMWRWNVDELERVNWPDYQTRIFKNNSDIKWKNKVHEQLEGFKNYTYLPLDINLHLIHDKTIERQEKQNNYYNTL